MKEFVAKKDTLHAKIYKLYFRKLPNNLLGE